MKRVIVLAFAGALVFHVLVLGFGGLVLFRPVANRKVIDNVDLLAEAAEDERKDEAKEEEARETSQEAEESDAVRQEAPVAPDLRELAALESPVAAPALAAMSLSDLESALGGGSAGAGGGSEFGGGFSFASGGRIGGTGTAETGGSGFDDILSAAELDQRPRPVLQASPQYPLDLRKRKVEGTVNVVFFVDKDGRVLNPQVENSSHPAFERPALEAVRQWRFEAGTRNGQKVSFKMRVPIAFHVS